MAHGGHGGGGGGDMGGIVPKTGHGTAVFGMFLAMTFLINIVRKPKEFLPILGVAAVFSCWTLGTPPANAWWVWLPLLVGGLSWGLVGNHEHNMQANERGRAAVQLRDQQVNDERARLNALRGYGRTER